MSNAKRRHRRRWRAQTALRWREALLRHFPDLAATCEPARYKRGRFSLEVWWVARAE